MGIREYVDVLSAVELIVIDVDGTLTDGSMYFSDQGEAMKRFSVRDGMGITLAHRAGIEVALMTSETSDIVVRRAEKLKIRHLVMGSHAKEQHVRELVRKIGTVLERTVFIGDDVNDDMAMRSVGFSACPADAAEYMKSRVSYVCANNGGDGAVREVIDAVLVARGASLTLPEHW
ncbi:MAG: KdsC family phosphatase [Candidatus Kapaibacterium sp.]